MPNKARLIGTKLLKEMLQKQGKDGLPKTQSKETFIPNFQKTNIKNLNLKPKI